MRARRDSSRLPAPDDEESGARVPLAESRPSRRSASASRIPAPAVRRSAARDCARRGTPRARSGSGSERSGGSTANGRMRADARAGGTPNFANSAAISGLTPIKPSKPAQDESAQRCRRRRAPGGRPRIAARMEREHGLAPGQQRAEQRQRQQARRQIAAEVQVQNIGGQAPQQAHQGGRAFRGNTRQSASSRRKRVRLMASQAWPWRRRYSRMATRLVCTPPCGGGYGPSCTTLIRVWPGIAPPAPHRAPRPSSPGSPAWRARHRRR